MQDELSWHFVMEEQAKEVGSFCAGVTHLHLFLLASVCIYGVWSP